MPDARLKRTREAYRFPDMRVFSAEELTQMLEESETLWTKVGDVQHWATRSDMLGWLKSKRGKVFADLDIDNA